MQPKFPKSSYSFIHKFSHKWIWVRKNECFTKFNQLNFKNFSDRNFFLEYSNDMNDLYRNISNQIKFAKYCI